MIAIVDGVNGLRMQVDGQEMEGQELGELVGQGKEKLVVLEAGELEDLHGSGSRGELVWHKLLFGTTSRYVRLCRNPLR
jgi:hypothetical protein